MILNTDLTTSIKLVRRRSSLHKKRYPDCTWQGGITTLAWGTTVYWVLSLFWSIPFNSILSSFHQSSTNQPFNHYTITVFNHLMMTKFPKSIISSFQHSIIPLLRHFIIPSFLNFIILSFLYHFTSPLI